jgi:molecular chaperone DnaK
VIESAIEELKKSMDGDDKADIEAKTASLAEVSGKLAERVYQKQAQDAAGEQPAGADDGAGGGANEDVVDAEFEEVKDDDANAKK